MARKTSRRHSEPIQYATAQEAPSHTPRSGSLQPQHATAAAAPETRARGSNFQRARPVLPSADFGLRSPFLAESVYSQDNQTRCNSPGRQSLSIGGRNRTARYRSSGGLKRAPVSRHPMSQVIGASAVGEGLGARTSDVWRPGPKGV